MLSRRACCEALSAKASPVNSQAHLVESCSQFKLLNVCEVLVCCRTGQAYTDVLVTNVVGPYLTTKYFLPLLKKKQTRKIVNTSSILGSVSWNRSGMKGENGFAPYFVAYNSSKSALNMRK